MNLRLKRHEDRKKALIAQSTAILDAGAKEDRDQTDEEKAAFAANEAELAIVQEAIDREVALAAHSTAVAASYGAEDFTGGTITISNPTPAWQEDPKKGFKSPREFFTAVLSATENGSTSDDRLKYLSGRRNGFLATAGSDEQGTYADPYGGFLVPTGFLPNLLTRGSDGDPTAGRTTNIPMATPKVEIPARTDSTHTTSVSGGLIVYRRSETQSVTATRMVVEQVALNAHPLMGLTYTTEELLSDSAVSFVALITAGFNTEFPSRLLREKIRGTGVGEMEGVISTPALVTVAEETGQVDDTIVYANLKKMRARCWGYGNAIWLYNQDCLPALMDVVSVVGVGGVPAWQNSAREGEPDMILGRPAFASEYCSAIGDVGDIILGNWSQYLEGTYQPMESAESMHVRFINNERTFRFTMRNDGRCWWRAALTPAVSAITLSPFVVLAAR